MADYSAPQYDPSAALQLQAEYEAAMMAYQNARLNNLEIPQLGFTATSDAIKNLIASGQLGLAQDQTGLQYLLGSGQLGLGQQTSQQQALQSAANAQSQEALNAMQLAASLQGPANAFQQQAVLEGLNNAGLSRGVGAIAGAYGMPTFQAPQARAQAASLGTLAQQFAQAPGHYAGMTPTQIAMASAEQTMQNAPSYAAPTQAGAYRMLYGSHYATPSMNASGQMWNAASGFDNGVAAKGGNPVDVGNGQGFGPFVGTLGGYSAPGQLQNYAMQAPGFGSSPPSSGATASGAGTSMNPPGYGYGGYGGGLGGYGRAPYSTSSSAYARALPNLNQINARNWMQLPTSTQQFLTSAYGAAGYSPQDVQEAVKNNLPQFKAPSFGLVGP